MASFFEYNDIKEGTQINKCPSVFNKSKFRKRFLHYHLLNVLILENEKLHQIFHHLYQKFSINNSLYFFLIFKFIVYKN